MLKSVAVLVLAIVFWAFFQLAKQDPANPFGEDPYDAVGSFAIQAATVLGLLSVVRSFGFLDGGPALLARTHLAAVLAVGITLVSDAIALLRHGGSVLLIALVVALACVTAAVGFVCRRGFGGGGYAGPAIVCAAAVVVLFFYPETTRATLAGALVAIAVGIAALFVPLRFLATALVAEDAPARRRGFPFEWIAVLVAAGVVGLLVAHAEAGAEGGLRAGVIFIFIGFEAAAAAFGYAMLAGPLRLRLSG